MTMFGLSVAAAIVIAVLAGTSMTGGAGVAGTVHSPYLLSVFASLGWWGFFSLLLGWLAAMGGASQGVTHKEEAAPRNLRDIRPAA